MTDLQIFGFYSALVVVFLLLDLVSYRTIAKSEASEKDYKTVKAK